MKSFVFKEGNLIVTDVCSFEWNPVYNSLLTQAVSGNIELRRMDLEKRSNCDLLVQMGLLTVVHKTFYIAYGITPEGRNILETLRNKM